MMKLLFKPTGNVFTLPDEEAINIQKTDRGNYEILDCAVTEEVEETISKEEVEAIETERKEALEKEAEELKEASVEDVEDEPKVDKRLKPFEIEKDYKNLTKKELAIMAQKVTGKYVDPTKLNKPDIIALIEGKGE